MAAKKTTNKNVTNLIAMIAIALGIFLVINGVLSTEIESWRALIIAVGMGVFAGGIIGYCSPTSTIMGRLVTRQLSSVLTP